VSKIGARAAAAPQLPQGEPDCLAAATCPPLSHVAYIGLGANLGEAEATVRRAARELSGAAGVQACRLSPLYRTRPVDAGGPDYVNGVVELNTSLSALPLWRTMQAIEQAHGRQRPYRNAPRTLDLDLLWFDGSTIDTRELTVPHPRLAQRAFVLRPLADLAPALRIHGAAVSDLLQHVDQSGLWPI